MATYEISIGGRGCEMVIGNIKRVAYDFWIEQDEETAAAHLFDDAYCDENGNPINDDTDDRFIGDWWENDSELHVHGALEEYLYVEVTDDFGNIVWTTDTVDAEVVEHVETSDLYTGTYIKAWSNEKGQFFVSSFDADNFDPAQLKFFSKKVDGDVFVTHATYNNNILDDDSGNTDVKGYVHEFYNIE
jgi:hypothetical protein